MGDDSLFDNLPLDRVCNHLEGGLYTTKRVAFFGKKMQALEEKYAKEMLTIIQHERAKTHRYDGGLTSAPSVAEAVWANFLESMNTVVNAHKKFAEQLNMLVVQPLDAFWKASDQTFQKLSKDVKNRSTKMDSLQKQMTKDRTECIKMHKSLTVSPDPKLKLKAHKSFQKYFQDMDGLRADQIQFFKTVEPHNLKEMHRLEQDRLLQLSDRLSRLGELVGALKEPYKNTFDGMVTLTSKLPSAHEEMQKTVGEFTAANGEVVQNKHTIAEWDLPCSPNALSSGELDNEEAPRFSVPNPWEKPKIALPKKLPPSMQSREKAQSVALPRSLPPSVRNKPTKSKVPNSSEEEEEEAEEAPTEKKKKKSKKKEKEIEEEAAEESEEEEEEEEVQEKSNVNMPKSLPPSLRGRAQTELALPKKLPPSLAKGGLSLPKKKPPSLAKKQPSSEEEEEEEEEAPAAKQVDSEEDEDVPPIKEAQQLAHAKKPTMAKAGSRKKASFKFQPPS